MSGNSYNQWHQTPHLRNISLVSDVWHRDKIIVIVMITLNNGHQMQHIAINCHIHGGYLLFSQHWWRTQWQGLRRPSWWKGRQRAGSKSLREIYILVHSIFFLRKPISYLWQLSISLSMERKWSAIHKYGLFPWKNPYSKKGHMWQFTGMTFVLETDQLTCHLKPF